MELGCGEKYRVIAQMWELYRADVGTHLGRGSLDDKFARNGTLTLSHQKPAASNIHTNCYTIESG